MKRIVFTRHDGFHCLMTPQEQWRNPDESDEAFCRRIALMNVPVVFTDSPEVIRAKFGSALRPMDPVPLDGPRAWAIHFGIGFTETDFSIVDDDDLPPISKRDQREAWKAKKCAEIKKK